MVLGFIFSSPAQEVRPVFRFVVGVLAHVVPGYVSFLRHLLIVVTRLFEEALGGWHVAWGFGRVIWPVVQDPQQSWFRIEGVYRQHIALCDRYLASPRCNTFGDRHTIVLFPVSSQILYSSAMHSPKPLLRRPAASHPAHSARFPGPSLSIRTFSNLMVSIYDVATSSDLPRNCDRTHELAGSYSRRDVEGKVMPCYIAMVSTP
ncbi:hypothetical protein IW262DRAFT_1417218 [Armillaria fumosa]|nr:hypothetical protein IW262DRAFT_1417218 [Armillaria fumosa]